MFSAAPRQVGVQLLAQGGAQPQGAGNQFIVIVKDVAHPLLEPVKQHGATDQPGQGHQRQHERGEPASLALAGEFVHFGPMPINRSFQWPS